MATHSTPKDLSYALHEAIWMYLENTEAEPRQLIDGLYALANGGPVGAASSEAQQLHLYVESLVRDVGRCIEHLENKEPPDDDVEDAA